MKTPLATILFCVLATGASAADAPGVPLDLHWMAGCWAFERQDTRYEEVWMSPTSDGALGMARALKDGRMRHFEFTRIEMDADGQVDYVANPSRQSEARFRLVELKNQRAVFENLQHDFPQRIIYARTAPDRLDARAEGKNGGKVRGSDYPFRRVSCAGG